MAARKRRRRRKKRTLPKIKYRKVVTSLLLLSVAAFTIARQPRTTIYYCHPYTASERGSNENMNRIIRRFFPKGTNFDEVTAAEVAQAETWMNDYPRAILGWRSAGALFAENLPQ